MKKKIRILAIISIIFIGLNIININISMAAAHATIMTDGGGTRIPSTSINPDDYEPSTLTTDDAVEVLDKVGVILGAIRNISTVVAVIVIMVIGFKYIMGSVEEKANYKATMWSYIIGCIMAVAGTTIVSFIYNSVK